MPARPAAIAGAVAVALGGAAIAFAVTRPATGGMSETQTTAMARAVDKLDGDIRAARAAVQARASTLSTYLFVRTAVATDAATAADQVKGGELQFSPENGEVLELGRIVQTSKAVDNLMVQPTGEMRHAHGGVAGSYAELSGDQLVITEVVKVAPAYNADQYTGFLSVTRPLPLAPALMPLVDAGITGQLMLADKSAPIGAMPPGAITHEHPLPTQKDVKLAVVEPPPRAVLPLPVLVGGIGALVIGLLLLVVSRLGHRAASTTTAFQALPTQPSGPPRTQLGNAATQLSQHGVAAAGTPAPGGSMAGTPGDSPIAASNLGPGAMIGRWEIVRRLGSGGMADVYLAQARGDGGFEKLVAIKVMHGHLARNQRAVDHFLDEARLAARIHHPNVVAIQDLGKIGNDYVIVMEYVEGVDLERLLASARAGQRPVPLAVALGILCRICDGLDAAHRATAPTAPRSASSTATSRAPTSWCRARAASRSSTSGSPRPPSRSTTPSPARPRAPRR